MNRSAEALLPAMLLAGCALFAGCQSVQAQSASGVERQIGAPAGNGDHPAIAFARADAPGYTFYRPFKWPAEAVPVVLWGNGACRDNGLSASHFLREIASHGYLVIANGAPREEREVLAQLPSVEERNPSVPRAATPDETSVGQMLAGIDWAIAANGDSADPLFGRLDPSRVAVMGHSCGGLQALAAGADRRIDAVVALASGVYNRPNSGLSGVQITKSDLEALHTPVAYIIGGPGDIAFPNSSDDFQRINHVPVLHANLPVGHGGTFALANGGDWARVAADWLDWQIRGDKGAGQTFTGAGCRLCTTYGWTVERKQFPAQP